MWETLTNWESRGKWVEGGGGVEKRTMGPWERRVKNKNQCQE